MTALLNITGAGIDTNSCYLEPKSFMDVKHMTGQWYEASPTFTGDETVDWWGIRITAPTKVVIRKPSGASATLNCPIPVCMAYMLGVPDLNHICGAKIVMRDISNNRLYQGTVSCEDGDRFFSSQMLPDDAEPSSGRGGYASWDITRYLSLPAKPATYELMLTVGKTRSNTTIVVVEVE